MTRGRDPLGDMAVDHAGFYCDSLIGNVDREDSVHARKADDNAACEWEGAAGESGTGAPGDEGDAMPGTDADNGLNFFSGARQDDGGRQSTKSSETVALVGLELIALYDHSVVADYRAKLRQNSRGEDFWFGFGGVWNICGLAQHAGLVS